ncbi:GNAT family N-acetyltransferase [Ruminococcus flavefaciens]|uniref:GNAT family N-acetyltransferase n=1 Tax=Ruminococcus flavefaciens TaxID=1265 RepID=UPI0002DC0C69|nr:GNAT family N-acetyltransferase [Ruminococcus flavefaciens]
MEIKRFDIEKDLKRLENYLRNCYCLTGNMTSWLPERLHDLIYRMDVQYKDCGLPKSADYIFIWEDNGDIIGCILPDGDAVYMSIKNGSESIFADMVTYAEANCLPLFQKGRNGFVDFLVIANDSLAYRGKILTEMGYRKQINEDYDNYVYPQTTDVTVELPDGYKLLYGDEYPDEAMKWSALNLGFHPELEAHGYRNGMTAYDSRKKSSMYADSFEVIITDENTKEENNVCAYCFVYVDTVTKTALIEPVSTRERYRHKGLGTALMHGAILKCREKVVTKCYVNSYDWRRKFYNAAGFVTEDSIGFWHKLLK